MTETSPSPWPRAAHQAACVLVFIGAVLRIARWAHFRCLWVDEIYLDDNIVGRNIHDLLFTPLTGWQAAPAGFLFLEKLAINLLGHGERALRFVSLVAGLLSLFLFRSLALRVLPWRGGLWAIALFVFFGPLIYYSNEVKPYSCDVAATLAISLVVLRSLENPTPRHRMEAAVVGALAAFISFPAAFVLIGLVLFTRASVALVWLAALIVESVVFVRSFMASDVHAHVAAYWQARGALGPGLTILVTRLRSIMLDPGAWTSYPDASLVLLLIGFGAAIRRTNILILLMPLFVALLASVLRIYPFSERLALFAVPIACLAMGAAIEMLWTSDPGVLAATVLSILILLPPIGLATFHLVRPPGREETLPAYRWLAHQWRAGDTIYLSHFAEASYWHYRVEAGSPTGPVNIQPLLNDPDAIFADAKKLSGHSRVWVVIVHADDWPQNLTPVAVDQVGRRVAGETFEAQGVRVDLYDCDTARQPNRISVARNVNS